MVKFRKRILFLFVVEFSVVILRGKFFLLRFGSKVDASTDNHLAFVDGADIRVDVLVVKNQPLSGLGSIVHTVVIHLNRYVWVYIQI